MSVWWDEQTQRYRSTLIHKIVWVWGWPALRWTLHKLPGDRAHELALPGIWLFDKLDRIWGWITLPFIATALIALRLVAFLPGFSWATPDHAPATTDDGETHG